MWPPWSRNYIFGRAIAHELPVIRRGCMAGSPLTALALALTD